MSLHLQPGHRRIPFPDADASPDVCVPDQRSRNQPGRVRSANPEPVQRRCGSASVTGLADRAELLCGLQQRVTHARRHAERLALLCIDLDHFAVVCSIVGSASAERILQEVGDRISGALRSDDLVAHVGSDEFVVVLNGLVRGADSGAVAARLLEVIGRAVKITQRSMALHASVGIALYPDDSASAESLLLQASLAMKRAKQRGRSRLAFSLPQ